MLTLTKLTESQLDTLEAPEFTPDYKIDILLAKTNCFLFDRYIRGWEITRGLREVARDRFEIELGKIKDNYSGMIISAGLIEVQRIIDSYPDNNYADYDCDDCDEDDRDYEN